MQADILKYAEVQNVAMKHGDKKGVITQQIRKNILDEANAENIHARKCFRVYYPDVDIE